MNLLERFYHEKWVARDPDAALALLADDFVYEDVGLGVVHAGKQEYEPFLRSSGKSIPDYAVRFVNTFGVDEHIAAEAEMSGTMVGELLGRSGNGQTFKARYAMFARVRDGLLTRVTIYWNPDQWAKPSSSAEPGVTEAPTR